LVVHALRTQGGSWKQLLQHNFSQEISKSIEIQEAGIQNEGSSKKAKKYTRMTLGSKVGTITPNSSYPIEKLVTKKSVVGEPTTSRKRKATQYQKMSPTLIQKDKRQKEDSNLGGLSDNVPEATMEVSLEPTNQVEKTPDLNLQCKKNSTQSKAYSSVLRPKDQLS
jgi:hypothetical protein